MEFCFDEAVKVLEAIVGALNGRFGKDYPPQVSRHRIKRGSARTLAKPWYG